MEEIQFGKHINNCKDSRKCLHRMHNIVTIVNAIEVQEGIVVIHGKIRNKRRNMEEKRDVGRRFFLLTADCGGCGDRLRGQKNQKD